MSLFVRPKDVLTDLVFIRETHQAASLLESWTGDYVSVNSVARDLMTL